MYCPHCGKKTVGSEGDDWDHEQICPDGHKWRVSWVASLMQIRGFYSPFVEDNNLRGSCQKV